MGLIGSEKDLFFRYQNIIAYSSRFVNIFHDVKIAKNKRRFRFLFCAL
jgi:hypothetical protein